MIVVAIKSIVNIDGCNFSMQFFSIAIIRYILFIPTGIEIKFLVFYFSNRISKHIDYKLVRIVQQWIDIKNLLFFSTTQNFLSHKNHLWAKEMSLKRILGQEKAFDFTAEKENKIEIAILVVSKLGWTWCSK